MHEDGIPWMAAVVAAAAVTYCWLAARASRQSRSWSPSRTVLFVSGCGVLIWGLLPQYLPYSAMDLRKHMLQHLMVGMLAPIGLVMAAPMTLVLRNVSNAPAKMISAALRSAPLQVIANPWVALVLNLGGMALLYFTRLYEAMMMHPALHYLVHVHFVLAGSLYAWVIAGSDPAPHRPSVPVRLVVLGVAVTVHSVLAQLLYAGWFVKVNAPLEQLKGGAELMYYGGDVTEMLLAVALVTTWHPVRRQTWTVAASEYSNG